MSVTLVHILCGSLLVGSMVAAVWMYRRDRSASRIEALLRALQFPTAAVVLLMLLGQSAKAPFEAENGLRLASSFQLFTTFPIYTLPGQGPVVCNMYPPGSFIAYSPAAVMPDPTSALIAASVLSMVFVLLPVWIAHRLFNRAAPWSAAFLCFLALAIQSPSVWFTVHRVRPDAPALGLVIAAAVCLLRPRTQLTWRAAFMVGLLCGAAVWTKQVMVFLYPPLFVCAWLLGGWGDCRRLLAGAITGGLLVSGVMILIARSPEALIFNAFHVPSTHPFYNRGLRDWHSHISDFARDLVIPSSLFLIALAVHANGPASKDKSWRDYLRANRWVLFALIGVAMLPAVVLNQLKMGGLANANSFVVCFILLAATLGLKALMDEAPTRLVGSSVAAFLAAAVAFAHVGQALLLMSDARDAAVNDQQQVFDALKRTPEMHAWFPWHPLPVIMATGRVDHTEEGLGSLYVMGRETRQTIEQYRVHMAPGVRHVIIPERWKDFAHGRAELLGPVSPPVPCPLLPGWVMMELPDVPPASPRSP